MVLVLLPAVTRVTARESRALPVTVPAVTRVTAREFRALSVTVFSSSVKRKKNR